MAERESSTIQSDQFIYVIQPTRPEMLSSGATLDEERIVSEHFAYLKELTGQGVVILAGRTLTTDENNFGIVIFKADSEKHAKQIVAADPVVRQGVMRAELYPYRVALLTDDRAL